MFGFSVSYNSNAKFHVLTFLNLLLIFFQIEQATKLPLYVSWKDYENLGEQLSLIEFLIDLIWISKSKPTKANLWGSHLYFHHFKKSKRDERHCLDSLEIYFQTISLLLMLNFHAKHFVLCSWRIIPDQLLLCNISSLHDDAMEMATWWPTWLFLFESNMRRSDLYSILYSVFLKMFLKL